MQISNQLNLLLPVYRGGMLFLGSLMSIENSVIPFDNIVISFNGDDSDDYDAYVRMKQEGFLQKKYTTLRTRKDLSATQHGKFFLDELRKIVLPTSFMMLLAHDDRISHTDNPKDQSLFFSELSPDTVYFPAYHLCVAGSYDSVLQTVSDEVSYSAQDFFWKTISTNVYTNMSGMIMPFFSFESSIEATVRMGTGARGEHFYCIAPGINHVCFTRKIGVLIGERADSDGKLLNTSTHRYAALYYVWMYMRNGHLSKDPRCGKWFRQLGKKCIAFCAAWLSDFINFRLVL